MKPIVSSQARHGRLTLLVAVLACAPQIAVFPALAGAVDARAAEPSFRISWKMSHAGVNGDLGFTSGTHENSFTGLDGRLAQETGKYLRVWRKQKDGSWKAVHDMWNGDAGR